MHDANSKGAINYLNLAREILQKNEMTMFSQKKNTLQWPIKKRALGRGLSILLKSPETDITSNEPNKESKVAGSVN